MFALIRREIEDNVAFFIAAAVFSTILVAGIATFAYDAKGSKDTHAYTYEADVGGGGALFSALSFVVIVPVVVGFPAMGASQMYTDRTRKISTFLSTLPVTRARILIARIITGTLAILILLVPLTITASILVRVFPPPYPIYPHYVSEVSVAVFLTGFACYCIGLQLGWSPNKAIPILGTLGATAVIIPIIVIKGFGAQTIIIMLLLIAASLTRTWQKFASTPL
jgi:ABC-type transport system involved in multi-copper enzyme maturation permease subunit